MFSLHLTRLIFGGLVALLLAVGGWMMSAVITTPAADMRLEPTNGSALIGQTFVVNVVVSADIPVNVFAGSVIFEADKLSVEAITYNTSIADLWAEEPWYSNGEGTIGFAGGTTKPGGFMDTGTLITITFKTTSIGDAAIGISGAQILQHDGLGSETPLRESIDAIFTVTPEELRKQIVVDKSVPGPNVSILPEVPTVDLNNDGQVSMSDMSIFVQHLATSNKRSDFNQDGRVSMADMSILLNEF